MLKVAPSQLTRKTGVFLKIGPPHSTAMFFVAPFYQELPVRMIPTPHARLVASSAPAGRGSSSPPLVCCEIPKERPSRGRASSPRRTTMTSTRAVRAALSTKTTSPCGGPVDFCAAAASRSPQYAVPFPLPPACGVVRSDTTAPLVQATAHGRPADATGDPPPRPPLSARGGLLALPGIGSSARARQSTARGSEGRRRRQCRSAPKLTIRPQPHTGRIKYTKIANYPSFGRLS